MAFATRDRAISLRWDAPSAVTPHASSSTSPRRPRRDHPYRRRVLHRAWLERRTARAEREEDRHVMAEQDLHLTQTSPRTATSRSNSVILRVVSWTWSVIVSAAVRAATELLPSTALLFGRASKPHSHHLFVCSGIQTVQFSDGSKMLIEVRSTGGYERRRLSYARGQVASRICGAGISSRSTFQRHEADRATRVALRSCNGRSGPAVDA
jgi:hypothetical protein